MAIFSFYCRCCCKQTPHVILHFDHHTNLAKNFSKIKCIKCDTDGFVVEYDKQATAPTSQSRRANEVIGSDEQPSDICWF